MSQIFLALDISDWELKLDGNAFEVGVSKATTASVHGMHAQTCTTLKF